MADTRYKELPDFFEDNVRPQLQTTDALLGSKLAQNPAGDFLFKQQNGTWTEFSKIDPVRRAMVQHWGGHATSHNLNAETIKGFIHKGDLVPVVSGMMAVPTSGAPCVEFKGRKYINTWTTNSILWPDQKAAEDAALADILHKTLRVWRENLCGRQGVLSTEEMRAAAESDDPAELEWRFFMNFLAKPYQQPGVNMQVNLWLLGNINGLGRGTLTSLQLPLLWPSQYVMELHAGDIEERNWTDSLAGVLWVIINELNVDYKNAAFWNTFIKANSCEGLLRLVKRNRGPFDALNFANWIFTSNNEQPRCLDSKDRRNALIQCFNSHDENERRRACDMALEVARWIEDTSKVNPALVARYAAALAYYLDEHRVDDKLLDYAPDTILKSDVTEATAKDIPGLYWLQNDDSYPRDVVMPSSEFVDYYNRFERKSIDARSMGGIMASLSRRGLVKRHKRYETKAAYWEVPSELFPRASDADEATRQVASQKVVAIAGRLPPKRG